MCYAKGSFEVHSAPGHPIDREVFTGQRPIVGSQHRLGGASSPAQLVLEVANPAMPANGHDEPAGRHLSSLSTSP